MDTERQKHKNKYCRPYYKTWAQQKQRHRSSIFSTFGRLLWHDAASLSVNLQFAVDRDSTSSESAVHIQSSESDRRHAIFAKYAASPTRTSSHVRSHPTSVRRLSSNNLKMPPSLPVRRQYLSHPPSLHSIRNDLVSWPSSNQGQILCSEEFETFDFFFSDLIFPPLPSFSFFSHFPLFSFQSS